jgi:predicted DCC family thiol-disulfide oxidoreductase YuxK
MTEKKYELVFFDGVCVLCNNWVKFVIKNDKKRKFIFANLQSLFAKKQLGIKNIDIDQSNLASIYVVKSNGEVLSKYKASTYVLKEINKLFLAIYVLNFILPKKIVNFFYDFIGSRRYKIFGKYDHCMLPDEHIKDRFINE